jgi:hypothetical protein
MGGDHHVVPARQGPQGGHHGCAAGRVQVGRGFVQQHQGRTLEHRPGQGQAALLSAGETGAAFAQAGLPAVGQGGQIMVQAGQGSGLPQPVRVGGASGGQQQVVQQGALKEVSRLGHPGHVGQPGSGIQVGQVGPVDPDAPLVRGQAAQQQPQGGGLAGAAGAGDGGEPGGRHFQVQAAQDGRAAGVAEPERFQAQGYAVPVGSGCPRPVRIGVRDRFGQDGQQPFGRGAGRQAGMVLGAESAQGQVEFRRQQQDEKAALEGHIAGEQAETDEDGHQGNADGGQEFEHQGREKSHAQHRDGGLPVLVGDPGDDARLPAAGAEGPDGGQALQAVQKTRAKGGQPAPLALVELFGLPADEHHEQGNEGRRAEQDQPAGQAEGKDKGQYGQGDQRGQRGLGQKARIVAFQALHAVDHLVGQFPRRPGAQPLRPHSLQMGVELHPDIGLDLQGRLEPAVFAGPDQGEARGHDGRQQQQRRPDIGGRPPVEHHRLDDGPQEAGLDDKQHTGGQPQGNGQEQQPPDGQGPSPEPAVGGSLIHACAPRFATRFSGCWPGARCPI